MPLTRYEIRNEYSLANPDLYRSAAKDDPEGLLEGVAMSGLVGIVRQLGDLAEFAAEVFHDLHEEVLATGARSHELLIRVQQLEGELPFVEKLMFAESCYVNFAYNPGSEWHANIQNAQNHFTQGDLPRFIRNAYEDCRGPPRLFLLDKFDIAGAGACLKRYTDPSFFRMEWASSELMKAEKEQQERRARRMKKKGRRHRNGERRDPLFALHMQPRIFPTSSKVENEASTSVPAQPLESQHGLEQGGSNPGLQSPEQSLEFSGLLTCEEHVSNLMANVDGTDSGGNIREASVEATEGLLLQDHDCKQSQSSKVSEEILRQDLQSEDASLNTPSSSPQQEHNPDEHHIATDDARSISSEYNADAGSAEAGVTNDMILEKKGLPTCVQENEDITDFASETDNYVDALTTIDSEVETDSEFKMVSQGTGQSSQSLTSEEDRLHQVACENLQGEHQGEFVVKDQLSNVVDSLRESESAKRTEPACVESQANNFLSSDDDLAPQKSTVPMVDSGGPKSLVMQSSTVQDGHFMDSQSRAVIPETPKTPEANEDESLKVDTSSSASHQLPEPAILLDNGSQTPTKHFDSLTQHFAEKASDIDNIVVSTEQHCQDNSGHPDSEASNNMELSPHSSEKSSVQAIKWSIDFPRHCNIVLDSDDELDEMHVSSSSSSPSPSPSSSSSILSSPRPSTLATTFFTKKPESPQTSVTSSPKSISHLSPDSAEIVAPSSSIHLLETDADSSCMLPPDFEKDSSRHSLNEISGNDLMPYLKSSFHSFPGVHIAEPLDDQSILEDGPEHFPPPPPLPPLEWRTSRRFGSIISSSVKESEPMPNITIKPQRKLQESFESSNQPLFHQSNCTEHNESTQCTAEHGDFRGSSAYSDILEHIENEESQQIHKDHDEGIHVSQIPVLHGGFQGCAAHLGSPEHPQNEEESHCSTDSKTILPCSEAISSNLEIPDIPQSPKILVEPYTHEGTRNFMHQADSVIQSETSCLEQSSFPSVSDLETYDAALPSEASLNDSFVDNKEQDSTVPVVQKDNHSLDRLITVNISQEIIGPLSMQHDISDEDSGKSSPKIKTIPIPSVVDQLSNGTKPPSGSSKLESERLSRTSNAPKVEKRDPLISAIASHDRSMLRKVPDWSQSSRTSRTDDREVLLEQIRTGSFSLRRTKVEKQEVPRRITNVNVAAILEKANAIRQAFAGSDDDEDDDWSDD